MAWDITFDQTWTQRIEKEERSFMEASEKNKKREHGERRHRSSRSCRSSSVGSQASSPLSHAGSRSLLRSASHSGGSRTPEARCSTSGSQQQNGLPAHLSGVVKFPVADKDLLTGRVEADELGRVPRIKMHPEKVKAMWWPGRGSYTKYNPEFLFEEPPAWTPADILKPQKVSGSKKR
eukprot:TRINITY_DN27415_c0_g2_i1.p1 TRINITY_DN27415_c0_g2~~TRINITY_DN27415_c0_g2_i1.p1  ORF type:complete len:178 (+),score=32.81 TRINITY_DN27415_c0_g2_i1:149-682(+)